MSKRAESRRLGTSRQEKSDTLVLQAHLRDHLVAIEAVLRDFPINVVMAGGSVLAAHWGHRRSTDIDLFIGIEGGFEDDTPSAVLHDQITRALGAAGLTSSDFEPPVSPSLIGFHAKTPDGLPYSLFESPYMLDVPPDGPWVEGTTIRAATHRETTMGKLLGRTSNALGRERAGLPSIPIRDIYDFAVMAAVAPSDLADAISSLSTSERSMVYNVYRYLPANLHQIDPDPIIEGKYEFENMDDLPNRVALAIRDNDIALIPPPTSPAVPGPPKTSSSSDSPAPTKRRGGGSSRYKS